jgi:nitrogen regulatory protein PII
MRLHPAKKVVIITERILLDKICMLIEEEGATGYTITRAGGKGDRNIRTTSERASVVDGFDNVKIESVVHDAVTAEKIITKVAQLYFKNYSGITYIETVEILRPEKFL